MKRLFALAALILVAFTFTLASCKSETDDDAPTQRETNTATVSPKTEDGTEITSASATASADASIATVAAAENGTVTTTTYAGRLAGGTLTNKDDPTDTISVSEVNDEPCTTDPTTPSDEATASTTYTVTIASEIENGTVSASKTTAAEGETITLTAVPADGYKLGSLTVKNGEESVTVTGNTFTMSAGDVTVSATFTAISYAITYNLDGGTNASATPASYTIESDDIILSSASKDGYTFSGWKNTNGEMVTTIAGGTTGNITLTAIWTTASGLSVTIAPDSTISVEEAQDDSTITLTASEGFTGYSWRIDGELASSFTGATVSEGGSVLTLEKTALSAGAIYQITISASKGNIQYGAQITVKK